MSMLVKVALFIVSSLFLGDDVVVRAEEPTSVVELDAATATGPTSPDVASEGTDAEDQLAAREAALTKREAELAAREAKLVDEMKAKGAEDQLAEREAALIRREAELAAREKEALAAQLDARERELARREAELRERSAAVQVKEDALMSVAVAKEGSIAEPDVGPGSVITETEKGLVDWTQNYVEATGMAVAPTGKTGAQAKALARRGAILDLQRNLLEFLVGVQIDAYTTMEDFMASDKVRSEIHGIIKNVETIQGDWDGEAYTVKGRIRMGQIRMVMAPSIPPTPIVYPEVGATPDVTVYVDPDSAPQPKSQPKQQPQAKKARYTGLIIDVRHLPYVPAMSFSVYDQSGRAVYGMSFVDQQHYLQSGLCAYYNNINYAKGEVHVAPSPIVAKAVKLGANNVDIFISNSDAAKIRASSYDFRRECKVIVVSR